MRRILFVVCSILWASMSVVASAQGKETPVSLDDLLGDWLNKSYADSLQATLSPLKSWKGTYRTSLHFKKVSDGFEMMVGYNFHEGVPFLLDRLRAAGTDMYALVYSKEDESFRDTGDNRFIYPDGSPDILTWLFTFEGKEQRLQFVRVRPTIEAYANRIVLAGTYTDAAGKSFVFTEDSEARWPDKTFAYIISLDVVLAHTDYFYLPGEKDAGGNISYAYLREKNKLYIYNVQYLNGGDFIGREDKPLYVLTPKR